MFDFEEFKKGKFAVQCDTEEKAEEFLKLCEEKEINWNMNLKATNRIFWEDYKKETCYHCVGGYIKYCDIEYYKEEKIKIIVWGNKEMFKVGDRVIQKNGELFSNGEKVVTIEKIDLKLIWFKETKTCLSIIEGEKTLEIETGVKTFTEVIRDIKENEVWESINFTIELDGKDIDIRHKDGFDKNCIGYTFSEHEKFMIQRKKYSFIEAYTEFEKGKEIESCLTKIKMRRNGDKIEMLFKGKNSWDILEINRSAISLEAINGKWYINN